MFLKNAWLQWNISNTHANTFDIIRWLKLVDDSFGTYTLLLNIPGLPKVFPRLSVFFPFFERILSQLAVPKAPEVFPQIALFSYVFLKVPKPFPCFLMFSYIFLKNGKVFAWFCSIYSICSSSFLRFPTISIKFPCFQHP